MRTIALISVALLATALTAAETPSFNFALPKPPLSLREGTQQLKAPGLREFSFSNPMPPRELSQPSPERPAVEPRMRVVAPRPDVAYPMRIKEADPTIDPQFVKPLEISKSRRGLRKE